MLNVSVAPSLRTSMVAVNIVHRLSHLLYEEYQVLPLGGISLRADVGHKGTEIAAYQHAAGLARDVLQQPEQISRHEFYAVHSKSFTSSDVPFLVSQLVLSVESTRFIE